MSPKNALKILHSSSFYGQITPVQTPSRATVRVSFTVRYSERRPGSTRVLMANNIIHSDFFSRTVFYDTSFVEFIQNTRLDVSPNSLVFFFLSSIKESKAFICFVFAENSFGRKVSLGIDRVRAIRQQISYRRHKHRYRVRRSNNNKMCAIIAQWSAV